MKIKKAARSAPTMAAAMAMPAIAPPERGFECLAPDVVVVVEALVEVVGGSEEEVVVVELLVEGLVDEVVVVVVVLGELGGGLFEGAIVLCRPSAPNG
jgi:hypothetical protein